MDIYSNSEGYFSVDPDGEVSEYYPTKGECQRAIDDGSAFALTSQPATLPKRSTFHSAKATQRVLLTGLDCIEGQADLFENLDGSR